MYLAVLPDCLIDKKHEKLTTVPPRQTTPSKSPPTTVQAPPPANCSSILSYIHNTAQFVPCCVTKLLQKRPQHNSNVEYPEFWGLEPSGMWRRRWASSSRSFESSWCLHASSCTACRQTRRHYDPSQRQKALAQRHKVRQAASPWDPEISAPPAKWPFSHVPTWTCNETVTLQPVEARLQQYVETRCEFCTQWTADMRISCAQGAVTGTGIKRI
jgi:hypothetical protein